MSKNVIISFWTNSASETEDIAAQIGAKLVGGETIKMSSDLGGGKTTFVRGLVRGSGSSDHVSSPSFKISNIYNAEKFQIYHFDFYRLSEPGLIAEQLQEVIGQPDKVVIIEWPNSVDGILPEKILTINIKNCGHDSRELDFINAPQLAYLTQNL